MGAGRTLHLLDGRRPRRARRPGPGDDTRAVARGPRVPAAAGRGRGRDPDDVAGAGTPPRGDRGRPRCRRLAGPRRPGARRGPRHHRTGHAGRGRGTAPWLTTARSAESDAVESDERRRLWTAVGALPEWCQRLLRIVAFENRPDYARLAVDLGMPVGSIGLTCGRCLGQAARRPRAGRGPDERAEPGGALEVVRRAWSERDPVPEGLVARMQAAAAAADTDLDLELMLLAERPTSSRARVALRRRTPCGSVRRPAAAARVAADGEARRVDGWVTSPTAMTVRVVSARGDRRKPVAAVSDRGRSSSRAAPGLVWLRLDPRSPAPRPWAPRRSRSEA